MSLKNDLVGAVERGDLMAVREILARQPGLIDEPLLDEGDAALHLAAWQGHVAIVNDLLARGASVNAVGDRGRTPLYYATDNGHLEVARRLIEAGGDLSAEDDGGTSALAAAKGYGAEFMTTLREAAQRQRGVKPPVAASDEAVYAIRRGDAEGLSAAVQGMLRVGGTGSLTQLLYDVLSEIDGLLVKQMFESGGETRLEQCYRMLEQLLLAGADPNGAPNDSLRPIHYAVKQPAPRASRILMAFGADASIKTHGGASVRDLLDRNPEAHMFEDVFT